jgi:hypothetical protein
MRYSSKAGVCSTAVTAADIRVYEGSSRGVLLSDRSMKEPLVLFSVITVHFKSYLSICTFSRVAVVIFLHNKISSPCYPTYNQRIGFNIISSIIRT